MQLGQFSALITVDGGPLPEYAVEYSADGTEATCWIASENEKNFFIKLEDTDTSTDRTVTGRVALDGVACGGWFLGPAGSRVTTVNCKSVLVSANTGRPFLFSKQLLTDDDTYLNRAISPDLGTIKVLFNVVKLRQNSSSNRFVACEPKILHERSKKAIGHSVQFGPEFHVKKDKTSKVQIIKTLATFSFKYRPIELLRAEGIAPPVTREERAVTPTEIIDLSMDVDEEDADQAEIKRLQARLDTLQKKNKRTHVKREAVHIKKEIKSEGGIFRPGEVIDLTLCEG
ncbi:hypothetical protein B0H19DRAFT_1142388 [Mycena capillaripes]|nr:hypothetical protein B0H19DRAFT_1142388 [Mycena capillaripes]